MLAIELFWRTYSQSDEKCAKLEEPVWNVDEANWELSHEAGGQGRALGLEEVR